MNRAAAHGQTEIELLRFHSKYCTDHGRAINNLEDGWPGADRVREATTKPMSSTWPQGYKIRAQILNYPDGNLGEAGIFISW